MSAIFNIVHFLTASNDREKHREKYDFVLGHNAMDSSDMS